MTASATVRSSLASSPVSRSAVTAAASQIAAASMPSGTHGVSGAIVNIPVVLSDTRSPSGTVETTTVLTPASPV